MLSLMLAQIVVCAIAGVVIVDTKNIISENINARRVANEQKGVSARNYQKTSIENSNGQNNHKADEEEE